MAMKVSVRIGSLVAAVACAAAIGLQAAAASGSAHVRTGTYKATVNDSSVVYHATWTVTVTAGRIKGLSHWTCCPGKRTDPLTGTIKGNRVVIVRNCTGQGAPACSQTYTGNVASNGSVRGTWAGSGAGGGTTFVLTPTA